MDVRQGTTDDLPGIRRVAHRSLVASYDFLEESVIEDAVERWYDEDVVADAGDVLLVGTVDEDVVGFSQSTILGEADSVGEISWLHVDPDYRDEGVGRELYDRTEELLRGHGVERIRGVVLAGHEEGARFYEEHGLEPAAEREVEIGGDTYTELFFESGSRPADTASGDVERQDFEGETVYVFRDRGEHGSKGDFHPAYEHPDGDEEDLIAWYCGACGSFDNAMDPMGRQECNRCGNVRKPTRWDASYL